MSLSEAQKRDAYLEAQHILKLDDKWQELMPGERKPNFRRAAREIIRRALGHKVRRNQKPLDIHGGMMHEHAPREAALIERTLRNGMHMPSVLHSFQHGATRRPRTKGPPFRNLNSTTHTCPITRSLCTTTRAQSITRVTTNRGRTPFTAVCTIRLIIRLYPRRPPRARGCPALTKRYIKKTVFTSKNKKNVLFSSRKQSTK